MKLSLMIGAVLVVTLNQPLAGQAVFPDANGKVLADMMDVSAGARVTAFLDVSDDEDRFETNLRSAWELALRRDGVIVGRGGPGLVCSVGAAESNSGLVFYNWQLSLYANPSTVIGLPLIPLLWQVGGIGTVGRTGFSAEVIAKLCADRFANEWLKWNPRR